MNLRHSLAALALGASVVGGVSAANAGVIFTDNFDGYPYQDANGYLNWVPPANWTVSNGTVDLIGVGSNFDFFAGANGEYIDLNGSNGTDGTLETLQVFAPGTYTLTFSLAGNQRSDVDKTTTISLGDWWTSFDLVSSDPLMSHTYTFTTTVAGTLSFADSAGMNGEGNQNIGNVLDSVSVATAPEASTWVMLGLGFAGIGYAAFRRGRKASIAIA